MAFVLAMLAGILALLFLIFHQQSSGSKKLDAHQEALRAGLFALEHVTRDLRALVTIPPEDGPDGKPERRYGDHRTPVRIGATGQTIAFFLPGAEAPTIREREMPCVPVSYALVPAGKTAYYTLRRSQGVGAAKSERDLPEVRVRDLRFRLLEPDHADPARRSPDTGWYVQVMLEAVDREDRQVRPLPALVRLDFPSRQAQLHGMESRLAYRAPVPLELAPDLAQVSALEAGVVNALRDLTRRFEAGQLKALEFEVAVQKAMAPAAGRFSGPRISGGVRVPNFAELSLKPHEPGEPIELADPLGNILKLTSSLTAQAPRPAPAAGAASAPGSAWWVDVSGAAAPGMTGELSGLLGTNSFGPLAGNEARASAPALPAVGLP